MASQLKISGYNFIREALTPDIIKKLYIAEPYEPTFDGAETLDYIYADYYIARKLTSLERTQVLSSVAQHYPLKLFTSFKNARNFPASLESTKLILFFILFTYKFFFSL